MARTISISFLTSLYACGSAKIQFRSLFGEKVQITSTAIEKWLACDTRAKGWIQWFVYVLLSVDRRKLRPLKDRKVVQGTLAVHLVEQYGANAVSARADTPYLISALPPKTLATALNEILAACRKR